MTSAAAQNRIRASGCDVRFDNLTRHLYATDASIYQIEPVGVAFPTSAQDASAVIKAAADENISVTPRGAGTSLVGNAIGEGLIVDFSRHNRKIDNLNVDNRSVRVGAGVVLDQLNAFLNSHGFCSYGSRRNPRCHVHNGRFSILIDHQFVARRRRRISAISPRRHLLEEQSCKWTSHR